MDYVLNHRTTHGGEARRNTQKAFLESLNRNRKFMPILISANNFRPNERIETIAMDIDYKKIERVIAACESEQVLQEALDTLESESPKLTKEEAIIRLLIDLPVAG